MTALGREPEQAGSGVLKYHDSPLQQHERKEFTCERVQFIGKGQLGLLLLGWMGDTLGRRGVRTAGGKIQERHHHPGRKGSDQEEMPNAKQSARPMTIAGGPEQGAKAGSTQPRVEPCPREPEHTGGNGDLFEERRKVEQKTTKNATVVGVETETGPCEQLRYRKQASSGIDSEAKAGGPETGTAGRAAGNEANQCAVFMCLAAVCRCPHGLPDGIMIGHV
ncbi:hypothetical protein AK812_SmicGene26310 [Symbiodinium microadriaticum]|uniref:Uncharacterized protein n=1 Tax=Symbiodinium microadriaticum TaxID=2951 RepID=A0A1Q9D9Q4_SYMMI|nr:hypothetical protein AK812_SmicGene26310 [Symbiodinium microadriaticum]